MIESLDVIWFVFTSGVNVTLYYIFMQTYLFAVQYFLTQWYTHIDYEEVSEDLMYTSVYALVMSGLIGRFIVDTPGLRFVSFPACALGYLFFTLPSEDDWQALIAPVIVSTVIAWIVLYVADYVSYEVIVPRIWSLIEVG